MHLWEHDRAEGRDRADKQQACPEGEIGGLADLHPLALFESFVKEKVAAGIYDAAFAGAFRERGTETLEKAIARLHEASAAEGAAP